MKQDDIEILAKRGRFQDKPLNGKLKQTHISWIILSDDFVFKIKKPVKFSFLDFSTLDKRKHFCEREVELNSRLSNIYLDVTPISIKAGHYLLSDNNTAPMEYAVRMRKVDPKKEMDHMLKHKLVSTSHIKTLAGTLANFHRHAKVVYDSFDLAKMEADFNDLQSVYNIVSETLGMSYSQIISEAIAYSNQFLQENKKHIQSRSALGFRRDIHGDFHSGNIFLTDDPIIFDCIEFNDQMRQIDILDEVAFFCMDMEARGFKDISRDFQQFYFEQMQISLNKSDRQLFTYYECYRANVRAKVTALKDGTEKDWQQVQQYLDFLQAKI